MLIARYSPSYGLTFKALTIKKMIDEAVFWSNSILHREWETCSTPSFLDSIFTEKTSWCLRSYGLESPLKAAKKAQAARLILPHCHADQFASNSDNSVADIGCSANLVFAPFKNKKAIAITSAFQ